MSKIKSPRGFFALVTVTIIGLVFLFAVLMLAQQGIMGRFILLDVENKLKSESYAEACIQRARIVVVNDPLRAITSPLVTAVGSGTGTCALVSLSPGSPLSTVHASSTVSGATSNFEAKIDITSGDVSQWKELPTL